MKIVLINIRTSYIMSVPFGITYLGAVLRNDSHNVKLFDIYPEDDLTEIIDDIKSDFQPDLIGYSVMTTNFHRTMVINKIMKENFPNSLFCAGGIHPTVRPESTLRDLKLDFIVSGEGENILKKICERIDNNLDFSDIKGLAYIKGEEFINNVGLDIIDDLDTIPFPARNLLPVEKYLIPPGYIRSHFLNRVLSIYTSRGCPALCTYCNTAQMFNRKVRRRSVDNVISEIQYLKDTYDIDGIYFHDETFTFQHKWVTELCERLEEINIKWGCQTRVNLVHEQLLENMKKSGCVQIDFGIETGSASQLKLLRKGTQMKHQIKALELTKKVGIRSFGSFMIGLPDETEEDILETIQFLKQIRPDFSYFNLFTPFPGTEAAETAIKNGKLSEDYFSKDYDMLIETNPLVNLSNMSTETLVKYHKKLSNMVLFSNYMKVLTPHNIRYIAEALFVFIFSGKKFFKATKRLMKNKNIEKYIFQILSNYQQYKSRIKLETNEKNYIPISKQWTENRGEAHTRRRGEADTRIRPTVGIIENYNPTNVNKI